ncbi:MAG TPA: transporter substrate-binding domain-containing protein [Candidatus Didemnitutus sp.]|nr:transporter substrate-binding domain-containing protein [Candidatus Didemnitutus sp.]
MPVQIPLALKRNFAMILRILWPLAFLFSLGAAGVAPAATGHADSSEMVTLTDDETAWIAAHPVIRVGHDPSYSPYALQNAAGEIVGIDPDYLEAISRRTGLKFENSVRHDWGEVLRDFRDGNLDLLLSLNHAKEREAYLIYTHPYASAYNVIITRSDTPILSALTELQGHTIAIPRGDAGLHQDLQRAIPGVTMIEYDDAAECYLAVARGEVYATVGDVANAAYYIRTHRVINLRFGSVVSASSQIYIGVRKDWPILADIINKALETISAEERQQISERWIAADTSLYRRWARAFKVAAVVASICFAVFLLLFFHNRRLARELAERRRIQAELEQTTIRLREASQEKSELMHMVAHDLRSPLGAIQVGLELLQLNPPLAEPARSLATRRVNESAEMMARLINDMLSAQNVEEGRFSLKFVQDDAVQLARTAVSALSTVAQHKRITIDADLPPDPVDLTTDFVALQQVVDNLLSNALKYSPPGARVEIAMKADSDRCRIEVRDQGPGVMPEEREKIFEKFKRGSAQPTQGEKSTGLGLWIVRRFVAALYGKVWCEPGPGGIGSNFIVEVPIAPPAR